MNYLRPGKHTERLLSRRVARRSMDLFAATLAGSLLACGAAWQMLPLALRRAWMPEVYEAIERSQEFYLALYRSEAIEHYVHYHGIDPEVDTSMRAAGVVFLGTSRMMLGFDNAQLRPYFAARGLRHYLLGFSYGETLPFSLAVMRRADLRPKWVIANTDGFFFAAPSRYGRDVMHSSRFNAFQVRFETETTFAAIRWLHRFLPFVSVDRTKSVWLRSRIDGPWRGYFIPHAARGFEPRKLQRAPVNPEVVRLARQLKDECDRRGVRLLLTFVPSPLGFREQGEQLAAELGVPFISPALEGMETYDGSHLTARSASDFTAAFLRELSPAFDAQGIPARGP